jgi:predicted small lipoprotein YifL
MSGATSRTVFPRFSGIPCKNRLVADLNDMSIRIKSLTAIILFLMFAVGCGQKGPLYLPGNASEIRSEVPVQNQADSDDEEDQKKETGTQ